MVVYDLGAYVIANDFEKSFSSNTEIVAHERILIDIISFVGDIFCIFSR